MGLKDNGLVKLIKNSLRSKSHLNSDPPLDSRGCSIISRSEHSISRKNISGNALKVLYRLSESNFDAFLVGGSVRDLLLNRQPKDFDIATNATPEQVRQLFRNSRIIGRRFRLVHVYFKDEIIEVSTFRANTEIEENDIETQEEAKPPIMIKMDNTYGTIEEDAWRRDFTVNALYYNIKDFTVVDFTDGLIDLKKRRIRMIGDPVQRFHEDPVRLLRAIRLAAKLNFELDFAIEKPLKELTYLLRHVPQARLLDEVIKLFFEGNAVITFEVLEKLNYLSTLFPELEKIIRQSNAVIQKKLIRTALETTDQRYVNQQRLTPGFLLAALLWPVLRNILQNSLQEGVRFSSAFHLAVQQTLQTQSQVCLITRRMGTMMQAIWTLQFHLEKRRSNRVYHLLSHRYFRAAFDLLVLRAEAGEIPSGLVKWWHKFQIGTPKQRKLMLENLVAHKNE